MRVICSVVADVCLLLGNTLPARADAQAEMMALIDKATSAIGGAAKVNKLQAAAWKVKCTFDRAGTPYTLTMDGYFRGWDQARADWTVEAQGMTRTSLTVINGKNGWVQRTDQVRALPKPFLGVLQNLVHAVRLAQMPVLLKDKSYKLAHLGELNINDRPALGLKATRQGVADVDIYFDKKTGIPVKCLFQSKAVRRGREFTYELFFTELKEMGGIKHFTKIALHRDGQKSLEFKVTDVQVKSDLDADLFAKPN
jgi:hypothetical protein